jgi:hypothetical protein
MHVSDETRSRQYHWNNNNLAQLLLLLDFRNQALILMLFFSNCGLMELCQ